MQAWFLLASVQPKCNPKESRLDSQIVVAVVGVVGTLAGGVVGTLLGHWLASTSEKKARQEQIERNWSLLVLAVDEIAVLAATFLSSQWRSTQEAPFYRVPTDEFKSSYAFLVQADEELLPEQVRMLSAVLSLARQFNRGLDQIAQAMHGGKTALKIQETINLEPIAMHLLESVRYAAATLPEKFPKQMTIKRLVENKDEYMKFVMQCNARTDVPDQP